MDIFPTATRHGLENLVANNLYLAMLGLFVLERFRYLSGNHSLFSLETAFEALTILITMVLLHCLRLIENEHQAEIARLKRNPRRATEWQKLPIRILQEFRHRKVQNANRELGTEETISQDEIPAMLDDHQDLRNRIKTQESQIKGLLELRRRQQQDARGETPGGIYDEQYLRSQIKLNDLKINRLEDVIQKVAQNGP